MNVNENLVLVLLRDVVGREDMNANAVDGRCLGFDVLAREQGWNGPDGIRRLAVGEGARFFACLPQPVPAGIKRRPDKRLHPGADISRRRGQRLCRNVERSEIGRHCNRWKR
jgi:hypothetical protein